MYLYTTLDCKKIVLLTNFHADGNKTSADRALEKRKELEKQLKTKISVWASMGGDNVLPEIK